MLSLLSLLLLIFTECLVIVPESNPAGQISMECLVIVPESNFRRPHFMILSSHRP